MDVKRDPAILRRKKIRRGILLGVGAVAVIAISVAVSRLKPAAPSIANARSTLWINKVKRGPFVREVRGAGTLVPEDIRWIPATTSGRVEKIVLRPGAQVAPGTVVLELSLDAADYGRVIGRGGRTANAVRQLVRAAAVRDGRRVLVDIVQ